MKIGVGFDLGFDCGFGLVVGFDIGCGVVCRCSCCCGVVVGLGFILFDDFLGFGDLGLNFEVVKIVIIDIVINNIFFVNVIMLLKILESLLGDVLVVLFLCVVVFILVV